jgi:hypothetical protein
MNSYCRDTLRAIGSVLHVQFSPMPPTYPPDADDDAKTDLLDTFEAQMESYQYDLSLYETWLREEKSAKAILLASMEIDLARSLRGLATSHLMWDHLCRS